MSSVTFVIICCFSLALLRGLDRLHSMRTRQKVPEVGKEPPEAALEGQIDEGQVDDGDQLVISVQHDVNDPNTIVLVR